NFDRAFEVWYRSLRLRRFLGPEAEIPALGKVGALAWDTGKRKLDIQFIGDRLIAAAAALPAEPERSLVRSLAVAYEQLRLSDRAVAIYERLLPDTPAAEREAMLLKIGQLYQARFNYPEAIAAYEQLLDLSGDRGDSVTETLYLRELIGLYTSAERFEQSLAARERLRTQYAENPDTAVNIPALLVAIGDDYAVLERVDAASVTYQEAYQEAWSLRQFATAADALIQLGALYERFERPEPAVRVYNALTQVQQRSRDLLGVVQTYDRLGNLHLAQDDPAQALAAFENALSLARTLQYEPGRFAQKVEQARNRLTRSRNRSPQPRNRLPQTPSNRLPQPRQ
ncbi:MAG: tetratricopeptide repeat protein, partial [Cyanobacteria bacterium J06641_5]